MDSAFAWQLEKLEVLRPREYVRTEPSSHYGRILPGFWGSPCVFSWCGQFVVVVAQDVMFKEWREHARRGKLTLVSRLWLCVTIDYSVHLCSCSLFYLDWSGSFLD